MINQNHDPKDRNPPRKSELRPVEDALRERGYPSYVIEGFPKLSKKDMHLAEIHRLAALYDQNLPNNTKFLNPVQARCDRKGRIWVDVMLEKKKGVSLAELKKIMKVHGKPGRGRFISGRVHAVNLPGLIDKAVKIQTARPLRPTLNQSVPSIKADKATLSRLPLPSAPNGQGVIVGIVDIEGCDFYHPNFIKDNKSRLLYLWDQNGKSGRGKPKPEKYDYGVEYSQERINQALEQASLSMAPRKQEVAYTDLDYHPLDKAHGTHVMDIAAGSSSEYPGVAPGADLIFVHVGKPTDAREAELKNLGSSKCLLDAAQYIFEKAGDRPVVINLSLAGNGGSHDGSSVLESALDDLLRKPGRAIVIAAGNTFDQKLHTSGVIKPNSDPYEIEWEIQDKKNDEWDLRQELEIWYDKNARLTVELLDPKGKSYGECSLGSRASTLSADSPIPSVLIRHDPPDPTPGEDENHINVFIANDHPSIKIGTWTIRLCLDATAPGNNRDVPFHAWIESYATSHSEFLIKQNQPEAEYKLCTLNTIGNGQQPIVVGSYDPRPDASGTSSFSSAGPPRKRTTNLKPEVCAPGEDIFAARATDPGGTTKNGTSQAAPHVTGLIALMFQVAKEQLNPPKTLNIEEIRSILLNTVDPKPIPGSAPIYNPHSGFGRINAYDALWRILHS